MFVRGAWSASRLRAQPACLQGLLLVVFGFSCFGQVGRCPFRFGGGGLWVAGMQTSNPATPRAFADLSIEYAAIASVGTHHLVTVRCGKSWVEVWPAAIGHFNLTFFSLLLSL